MERLEPSYSAGGNGKKCTTEENSPAVPQKVKYSYHIPQRFPS
jgi:hypothetical protein